MMIKNLVIQKVQAQNVDGKKKKIKNLIGNLPKFDVRFRNPKTKNFKKF